MNYLDFYNRYKRYDGALMTQESFDRMILEECQECINRERAKDIAALENLWTEEHY